MATPAVAGAVAAGSDDVGTDQSEVEQSTRVATQCRIAIAALTTQTCQLKGRLIEIHIISLVGGGTGIGSRHRDIDRVIQRERLMDKAPGKGTVAAVSGAVAAGRDDAGTDTAVF